MRLEDYSGYLDNSTKISGKLLKWYFTGNVAKDRAQMNEKSTKYLYLAMF